MSLKVIGCDVGGTFTDVILLDQQSGEIRLAKVPTTVGNQADGVLAAIAKAGQSPAGVCVLQTRIQQNWTRPRPPPRDSEAEKYNLLRVRKTAA